MDKEPISDVETRFNAARDAMQEGLHDPQQSTSDFAIALAKLAGAAELAGEIRPVLESALRSDDIEEIRDAMRTVITMLKELNIDDEKRIDESDCDVHILLHYTVREMPEEAPENITLIVDMENPECPEESEVQIFIEMLIQLGYGDVIRRESEGRFQSIKMSKNHTFDTDNFQQLRPTVNGVIESINGVYLKIES